MGWRRGDYLPDTRGIPCAFAIAVILPMAYSGARAEPGDAEKARQMMERVVTAIHQTETAALQKFNAGTPGFVTGNIYPFCFRLSDGTVMTGQTAGSDIGTFPGVGQQLSMPRRSRKARRARLPISQGKPPWRNLHR